jgi:aryl-alcohol dehydrogenase-like predicted oxidoreductase
VDLLQFHVWEDAWAREAEWQDTVAELKASGGIKGFGLSLNRWQPENGLAAIETGLVDTVQVIYNIFDQAPEDRLFPACRARNIGVIARVPLDEGSLGGKLTLDTRFPAGDWRAGYFKPANLAETIKRVEALKEELPEGMSLPELALRFILSDPAVSTLIAGMRAPEHVRGNLAISDKGPLPADLLARLRAHRWDRRSAA